MANDLANRHITHMALETQHKAAKMEWREKIAHSKGALKDLAESIRDQARKALIECTERYDPDSQKIILTRNDTGEKVEFRAATEDEILEYEGDVLQGDLLRDGGSEDGDEAVEA
jgi:hypothetical protein